MAELWDLYDRERKLINKQVERGTKLANDEYHLVTNAYIKNSKGKFLISQRSENKKHPLKWECTGGSVITTENTYTGAIREVKEELGIDISDSKYDFVGSKTRFFKGCPDIVDVFIFYKDIDINDVIIQKEEVRDVKWATKQEILEIHKSGMFETTSFLEEVLNFDR